MKYELTVGYDGHSECLGSIECDPDDIADRAESDLREWMDGGDWGAGGAEIRCYWQTTDENGDEQSGHITHIVEPDHDALIAAAGGDPDCEHEWIATYEQEGGCRENPGVWSLGGTAISHADHCSRCGLLRKQISLGSHRNPGDTDSIIYEMPQAEED